MKQTYTAFLDECKYLAECREYLSRGIGIPKTIHGKTLAEFLVIERDELKIAPTSVSVATQTDIEITPRVAVASSRSSTSAPNNTTDPPAQNSHVDSSADLIEDINDREDFDESNHTMDSDTPNKRKRILIGRNVEKLPQ